MVEFRLNRNVFYGLMAVLRNRAVLGLSLMSFTFAFTQLCFITFLVSYLNLALGLPEHAGEILHAAFEHLAGHWRADYHAPLLRQQFVQLRLRHGHRGGCAVGLRATAEDLFVGQNAGAVQPGHALGLALRLFGLRPRLRDSGTRLRDLRLQQAVVETRQRLALAREAGCNAVASYIPWLVHELPDGSIDVTGATDPQRDVGAFIDLVAEEGMWFIARPGPFVMAELKNEGLPYRLYREHPEIIPVGWDARPTPSASVDYLASAFLEECRRWYRAIGPVLADRLITRGGPVIMMQLDNEIGMLDWVTNSPALTDGDPQSC